MGIRFRYGNMACALLRYPFTKKRVQTLEILQLSARKQASFTAGAFKLC